MQQDWFREWLLKSLCLPADAVVYPPANVHSRRPDLKVVRDGSVLAMIEVELGTDRGQAEDYRETFHNQEVKTIWGKRKSGADMSLAGCGKRASRTDMVDGASCNATISVTT